MTQRGQLPGAVREGTVSGGHPGPRPQPSKLAVACTGAMASWSLLWSEFSPTTRLGTDWPAAPAAPSARRPPRPLAGPWDREGFMRASRLRSQALAEEGPAQAVTGPGRSSETRAPQPPALRLGRGPEGRSEAGGGGHALGRAPPPGADAPGRACASPAGRC